MKEILITSTVLIIGILLIRRIFRGKISSRLQYALWLLVALRLVLPVSAQIDLRPLASFRLLDLVKQIEAENGDVVERLEEPIRVTASSHDLMYRLFVSDEMKAAEKDMPKDGPTSVFMAASLGFSRLDVLWFLWAAGVLVVGAWIIGSNLLFSRRLRKIRQPFDLPEGVWTAVFGEESGKETGKRLFRRKSRLPALYLAEGISSPCLYGLPGREDIYLTADVAEDENKLRHVLAHELVHKRHGDSFWAILRSTLAAVYWFHPLVWAAAVCSKRDCELACDEGALLLLGEEERISYGETLLSIITRRGRLSDLVCTATTMTGSGRSVKERIRFIAEKPKMIYAAVGAVLLLTVAVCFLVFTKNPQFNGVTVDSAEGLTVTGADMQIQLPASIGGISGCLTEEESDSIVIYHIGAQREVGRFAKLMARDALQLVDEGREVVPIGNYGRNYFLRAYMGEPISRTEHTYTPAAEATEHMYTPEEGATQGALSHKDVYLENDDTTYVIKDGKVFGEGEVYKNPLLSKDAEWIPLEEEPTADEAEDDDTTYIIEDNNTTYIIEDNNTTYIIEDNDAMDVMDAAEEPAVDYLPNENITTTVYQPVEVNVDNIDNSCYVYVRADFSEVPEKYREEMEFIDSELQKAADGVIVLSLNRELREQLFDALTENRTPYVGDNAKVGNLLTALPLPPTMNRTGDFSLQTVEEPYSLRFSYEMSTDFFTQEDKDMLYFNAAMLFYAIGNVEEITMEIKHPGTEDSTRASYLNVYKREVLEEELPILHEVDYEDEKAFREGLDELGVAVEVKLQE